MIKATGKGLAKGLTTAYITTLLGFMGAAFGIIPGIRKQIKGLPGAPYRSKIVFQTFDKEISVSAIFNNGMMTARPWAVESPDVTVAFVNDVLMKDLLSPQPKADIFNALLDGDVVYTGNLSHLARFSFLTTEMIKPKPVSNRKLFFSPEGKGTHQSKRPKSTATKPHEGVEFLSDPALSEFTLEHWPNLKDLWQKHFTTKPEVCSERARLMTRFFHENGFETDNDNKSWNPIQRQGLALSYLLLNKTARVEDDDLLLGTTTEKRLGVPIFPEFGGIAIWPELNTLPGRELNPYDISETDKRILNEEVLPFWIDRNVREYTRCKNGNALCQRLEERWVLYFMWKVHAISHTIPDFPTALSKGLVALAEQATLRAEAEPEKGKRKFHRAVALTLSSVNSYAQRMGEEALEIAKTLDPKKDKKRIAELKEMAKRVMHAPAYPARNLAEAVNAIWIVWLCLHQENMNAGLSLGRLDVWLQPYFTAEMKAAKTKKDREAVVHKAVELCGALFLKCQDHLPLVPDIGNRLFGGSSSDQAVTLGGVDKQGKSAVCDMTYIFLKVTEILGLRDPNVNARYHPGINPKAYLRRLLEVNTITGATPSIHNDAAIIASMENQGFTTPDARDWSATGCVEPTSSGRHIGHTNCMLLNLVAPLEMSLNDGVHPLVGERIGRATGNFRNDTPPESFEDFFDIYKMHLKVLIDHSVQYNNQLGRAHQVLHPTPLLSAMIDGTAQSGLDITAGGAKYNSSGVALVALTDVVDSLLVIKHLVYDEKKVTWEKMLSAVDSDFKGHDALYARIMNKVPKFGSPKPEPGALAQELIDFCHQAYQAHDNYRGGKYTVGFWSMSNHVAFGVLSGALPSGRKKGEAFTPGITPIAGASNNILDPIRAIAALDPLKMPNNIAFNVKLVPAPGEMTETFVNNAADLAQTYMNLGGMQMQFNVVTSETLKDAMANPAQYRNLLVRISGYNAYFVELNKDAQIELIQRAEFQA